MPPAARITDMHVCPKVEPGPVPHIGGPTTSGEATVIIGYQKAARVGDSLLCVGPGVSDSISQGEPTVIIGGKDAARLGDPTSHGGVLVAGCPTVIIGSSTQSFTIHIAAQSGTPFCEECEKKRQAAAAAAEKGPGPERAAAPAPVSPTPSASTPPASTSGALGGGEKTGLGDDVDQLAAQSPTLQQNLKDMKSQGWTVEYGEAGKGSYASRNEKKVVIDSNDKGKPEAVVQTLAHESGHALYTPEPQVPYTGLSREDYVDKNVKIALKDEGEATLTNVKVRQEILDKKGPDIGIAGTQGTKYEEIAKKYPAASDRDKARAEIGQVFAKGEHPSTDPSSTYYDYYAKPFQDHYDKYAVKKGP
jgi:uncharacterized Zn-binding protein involved in type VI secretion